MNRSGPCQSLRVLKKIRMLPCPRAGKVYYQNKWMCWVCRAGRMRPAKHHTPDEVSP